MAVKGFDEQYTFISIRNIEFVTAFEQYFNLLWSKAKPFDRAKLLKTAK
jgi:hypothetical protein